MDKKMKTVFTLVLMPIAAIFLFTLAFVGAAFFSRLFPKGQQTFDWHYLYILLLCIIFGLSLKLKVPVEVKATFSTVPFIAILVKIAIQTYMNVALTYGISAVFISIALVYLIMRKRHWLYIYAVVFTSLIMLINGLSGADI